MQVCPGKDERADAQRFELMYREWNLDEMKKIIEKWQQLRMKEGYWGG